MTHVKRISVWNPERGAIASLVLADALGSMASLCCTEIAMGALGCGFEVAITP